MSTDQDILKDALDLMGSAVVVDLAEPGKAPRALRADITGLSSLGDVAHVTVHVEGFPAHLHKLINVDHIAAITPIQGS